MFSILTLTALVTLLSWPYKSFLISSSSIVHFSLRKVSKWMSLGQSKRWICLVILVSLKQFSSSRFVWGELYLTISPKCCWLLKTLNTEKFGLKRPILSMASLRPDSFKVLCKNDWSYILVSFSSKSAKVFLVRMASSLSKSGCKVVVPSVSSMSSNSRFSKLF